jgi:hypothetical protein
MPNTYTELRTTTLGTATSSVSFNLTGISGYTDLVMVVQTRMTSGADAITYTLNGDTTGTNYSQTGLGGDGSSSYSYTQNLNTLGAITSSALSTIVINFQNYSNTTTFKTTLARTGSAAQDTRAIVSLWSNTAAVTSIALGTYSSTFAIGSTFSLYGIANADQGAAKATGGIITEDSQYWYHTFGASSAFIPKQSLTCDVLVVAGGGGGGYYYGAGGGGGGVQWATSQSLTAISYPVTIGAGGPTKSSGTAGNGTVGVDSSFSSLVIAKGGGYGAGAVSTAVAGGPGGSGGGAGGGNTAFAAGGSAVAGTGGTHYGNAGGGGSTGGAGGTGGGGGAGAVGGARVNTAAANGGIGLSGITLPALNAIGLATSVGVLSSGVYYIAGGGADSNNNASVGGLGGGGNFQTSGLVNTGGGAGGDQGAGGGGSGVVIVRYAK